MNGKANDDLLFRVVCKSVPPSETVPKKAFVADAYVKEPREVEEFWKVWRAVKELAVYVFGIVVEEFTK